LKLNIGTSVPLIATLTHEKDPIPENSVDVNSGEVSERPRHLAGLFFDGMIIELLIETG
jgi:hypothetical protein